MIIWPCFINRSGLFLWLDWCEWYWHITHWMDVWWRATQEPTDQDPQSRTLKTDKRDWALGSVVGFNSTPLTSLQYTVRLTVPATCTHCTHLHLPGWTYSELFKTHSFTTYSQYLHLDGLCEHLSLSELLRHNSLPHTVGL